MKVLTLSVEQSRELDRRAIEEYAYPSFLLMENAGRGLAKHTEDVLFRFPKTTLIAVLCGGGNNGGDGFVAARHLFQNHHTVLVYLLSDPKNLKGDALTNYKMLRKLGVPTFAHTEFEKHRQTIFNNTPLVILDAMLGTGFEGELRPPVSELVAQVNYLKKYHNTKVSVIAVDIPSGLNGDDGPVGPAAMNADLTVTFACVKKGLAKAESKPFVGRLEVVDIGLPEALLRTFQSATASGELFKL